MDVGRSYRPLIAVILVSGLACGLTWVFMARTETVVRAPGVLYPVNQAEVRSPVKLGRVVEVFKTHGDKVAAGENILTLDAEDEKYLREAVRKRIAGIQEEIKEHAREIELRKATAEMARAAVKEAAADVLTEKARLAAAQAAVKRAEPAATDLELSISTEKLQYAIKSEEQAKITAKNYEQMLLKNAIPQDDYRKAQLEYEKAQSLTKERSDELKLLKNSDIVYRLEDAKAEAARRDAVVKTAEAKVDVKQAEVKTAEIAITLDEKAMTLAADLERQRVEELRLDRVIKEKVLRAPASGLLYDFRIKPGQWINDRATLGTIYDASSLIVYAHVQQRDIGKIVPGQKAKITLDGLSHKDGAVEAEVLAIEALATPPKADAIEPAAIFQEPVKGAFMPRALVKLKLRDSPLNAKLRVGFTGSVKILINPNNALAEWFF